MPYSSPDFGPQSSNGFSDSNQSSPTNGHILVTPSTRRSQPDERTPLLAKTSLNSKVSLPSDNSLCASTSSFLGPPPLERQPSTVYTSFPIPAPTTPWDERDQPHWPISFHSIPILNRLFGFHDPSNSVSKSVHTSPPPAIVPKFSRDCFVSEFKCYARWIVPTFLVFGLFAISLAFLLASWERGSNPP